jgi:hypothetical protein
MSRFSAQKSCTQGIVAEMFATFIMIINPAMISTAS